MLKIMVIIVSDMKFVFQLRVLGTWVPGLPTLFMRKEGRLWQ